MCGADIRCLLPVPEDHRIDPLRHRSFRWRADWACLRRKGKSPARRAAALVSAAVIAMQAFLAGLAAEGVLGAAGVLVLASGALAHVTLEQKEAPVGAFYKAVLQVPHGCEGSATVALRVRIPQGYIDVKPMPKPGWRLEVKRGAYAKPVSLRDAKVSEGVTEVDWSGGNLPDAYYDEFVLTGTIGDDAPAGQAMYFPVVQECEKGVHRWIEIPAAGAPAAGGDPSEPAPALKLAPKR